MTLPDNFAFRFGDMPQYLHHANKDNEGTYHISWDQQYLTKSYVSWYTCTDGEIECFIAEDDGWVIQ